MSADAVCPVCDGGGIVTVCANDGKCGCSHTYDREYPCYACNETGSVSAIEIDREGELITFDGCQCDMNEPCSDALCQMQRDLEMRRAFASYRAAAPSRDDIDRMTFAEILVDAGRGHLVRGDEWGPVPF